VDYPSALDQLGPGTRITREWWPDDMFLLLVPGSRITVTDDRPLGQAAPELIGKTITYAPHVDRYASGLMSVWIPDAADEAATDWKLVP
jgi:hypothetical protein